LRSLDDTDKRRSQQSSFEKISLLVDFVHFSFTMLVRLDAAHRFVNVRVELPSECFYFPKPCLDEYVPKLTRGDLDTFTEPVFRSGFSGFQGAFEVIEYGKYLRYELRRGVVGEILTLTLDTLAIVFELGLFASNEVSYIIELTR
jgi:hypothetical protein